MREINTIGWENTKKIVLTLLLSIITAFLIIPLLPDMKFLKNFILNISFKIAVGIASIVIFILILIWQYIKNIWQKYWATKKVNGSLLLSVDLLVIYLLLTAFLAFLSVNIVLSFVFLFCLIIFRFIWAFSRTGQKKGDAPDSAQTHSDEPINKPEQDILRRGKFVEDLYLQIVKLPTDITGSFTFGLYGSWGEGKTSIINLLMEKFATNNNQDFLIIRFEPWYFQDENAILTAFYSQIEKAISDRYIFPNFTKAIQKYQKVIETGISIPGLNFGFKIEENSIEHIKERIEKYIEKINKRILIIIDDIDRLQPEEAQVVFKMVRKNTNFKGTIFLLSFDLMIIKEYLNQKAYGNPEFLDKIVNMPIHLPAIEQLLIDEFLSKQILDLLMHIGIEEAERQNLENNFLTIYKFVISKLFKTLRQAKRFMNALYATLPSIKSEVNIYDFIILEVIKLFKPEIYKDIWQFPWIYQESNNKTMWSSPYSDLNPKDRVKEKESIKKHLDKLLKGSNQDIFTILLIELFPGKPREVYNELQFRYISSNKGDDRIDKRISNPDCFDKYFTYLTPSLEISDQYIETVIENWKDTTPKGRDLLIETELFNYKTQNRTYNLLWKLSEFNKIIDSSLALSIIKVIYTNANRLSREEIIFFDSELTRAVSLIILLIEDKVEKKEIQKIIEDAVMNTPDLLFSMYIIENCRIIARDKGDYPNIAAVIDINDLHYKFSNRLKEYLINGKRDMFDIIDKNAWTSFLSKWNQSIPGNDETKKKIIHNYVLSLVKEDAKKFSDFLDHIADRGFIPNGMVNFNKFNELFDYKEFAEVAKKHKNDTTLTDEEKSVITEFLKQTPNS